MVKASEGTSPFIPSREDRVLTLNDGHPQWQRPGDLNTGFYNKLSEAAGSGIDGIAETYKQGVIRMGEIIYTQIFIDLTGLNSNVLGDIIGDDAAANCHIGQISTARNGTMMAGQMSCLETPAGGEPDIDLHMATEATGAEDAAISGLTNTELLAAGADWTANLAPKGLTALPTSGKYLYLVNGGATTDATYTAGKFRIELWGYEA